MKARKGFTSEAIRVESRVISYDIDITISLFWSITAFIEVWLK